MAGLAISFWAQVWWDPHERFRPITQLMLQTGLSAIAIAALIIISRWLADAFVVFSWALVGLSGSMIFGLHDSARTLPNSSALPVISVRVPRKELSKWSHVDIAAPPSVRVQPDGSLELRAIAGYLHVEWTVVGAVPSEVPPTCRMDILDLPSPVATVVCPADGEKIRVPVSNSFFRTGDYETGYGVRMSEGPGNSAWASFDDVSREAQGAMRKGTVVEFPTWGLSEKNQASPRIVRGVGVNRGDTLTFVASEQALPDWDAAIAVTNVNGQQVGNALRDLSLIVLGGAVSLRFRSRRRPSSGTATAAAPTSRTG